MYSFVFEEPLFCEGTAVLLARLDSQKPDCMERVHNKKFRKRRSIGRKIIVRYIVCDNQTTVN